MKLLLKCNKCGNNQYYMPRDKFFVNNTKRCVYCGKSFKIKDHILKKE